MRLLVLTVLALFTGLNACAAGTKAPNRFRTNHDQTLVMKMIPRVASSKNDHVAIVAYGTEPLKFVFTNRSSERVSITFAGTGGSKAFHAGDPQPNVLILPPTGKGIVTLDVGCDDGSRGMAVCEFMVKGKKKTVHAYMFTFESLDGE